MAASKFELLVFLGFLLLVLCLLFKKLIFYSCFFPHIFPRYPNQFPLFSFFIFLYLISKLSIAIKIMVCCLFSVTFQAKNFHFKSPIFLKQAEQAIKYFPGACACCAVWPRVRPPCPRGPPWQDLPPAPWKNIIIKRLWNRKYIKFYDLEKACEIKNFV